MPRRTRYCPGGFVYHVLNRAAARERIFASDADYAAFERVVQSAGRRVPIRLLSYCVMPNHWHLLVWPNSDHDLSCYMHWLTTAHTQRWHLAHGTSGTGPLYQGRFKSFPIEEDDHFYRVARYIERNAKRANLVGHAEMWRWSSLWQFVQNRCDVELHEWPLPRPIDWLSSVNRPETEAELRAIRHSVQNSRPFGSLSWARTLAFKKQ